MKATNAANFLKMLNPSDPLYGFKKLSNGDVDKLIKYYQGKKHLLRGLKRDEAKGILWEKVYKGDKNDLYGEDLLASGVLEVPATLRGLSVKGLREKLTKHKLYSYKFKVSYESTYKHAIRVLQQSLNVSVTGRYTVDVAKALYQKIKADVPKKKGYLASEDDPDRLFQNGFEEYVFCVDQEIWALCGVEEKFLVDDNGKVWVTESTDGDNYEELCRKALRELDEDPISGFYQPTSEESMIQDMKEIEEIALGRQTISASDSPQTKLDILKYNAKVQARDILDDILGSLMDECDILLEDIYQSKLDYQEMVYNVISFIRSVIWSIPDLVVNGINVAGIIQQQGATSAPFDLRAVGIAIANYLFHESPDIKELLNMPDLPTDNVDKAKSNLEAVTNSEWKYLIPDVEKEIREKFSLKIQERLDELTDVTYTYGDSILETRLYNLYIRAYLEDVKLMNEYANFSFHMLDKKLE